MSGWLPGLALLALPTATQDKADESVLVDGRRYQGVVFEGTPWQPGRTFLEGGGKGNALFAEKHLGPGDFLIVLRLSIAKKDATGAALRLGESDLGLDGEGGRLFTSGPLFGGATAARPPGPREIVAGRPFDLEVHRAGGRLVARIDGQVVLERDVGDGRIGRFGLVPGKARLSLHRFAVSGAIETPPREAPAPDFQPAIDAAIERGADWLLARQLRDGSWQNVQASFAGGQTALSCYALLRSGLPAAHPSVTRGLENLSRTTPRDTYSAGLMLMAFEATADPAWRERMRFVLKELLAWQEQGEWSYAPETRPGAVWNDALPRADLSNTQYAVLGLRAAAHAGLEVPDSAWTGALEAALALQENPENVEVPRRDGRTGTESATIAGFRYRHDRGASGSMTCAGLAVAQICRAAVGKRIKADLALETARALQLGAAWLDHRFNLEQNFGDSEALNHYYYLYGIERAGTLLEVESFGGRPWYVEGARWLLKSQEKEGTWATRGYAASGWREVQDEIDTCFAILFLKRASRPTVRTSGGFLPRGEPDLDPTEAVRLRAFGRTEVALWIGGFGAAVRSRAGGARVASVEYLLGQQAIERVEGDPSKPWIDETYAVRHTFAQPGRYSVRARVRLAYPDETLESKPVEVVSDGTLEPWMKAAAIARDRNLVLAQDATASASSSSAADHGAERAIDGLEATLWTCAPEDVAPTLTIEWPRPVKADRLVLNGACSRRQDLGKFDRIRSVAVRLNRDKEPAVHALGGDEIAPFAIELPKGAQVRRIEIRIVSRADGGAWKGRAGFTEVALERRP